LTAHSSEFGVTLNERLNSEQRSNSILASSKYFYAGARFEHDRLVRQELLNADLEEAIVWTKWEDLRNDQVSNADQQVIIGTAAVTAGLVSVGYVMFALRGGMFLATVYSSLPAWRMIDPANLLVEYRGNKQDAENDLVEKMLD